MTQEEKQQLNQLIEWQKEMKRQQLSMPIDEASMQALSQSLLNVIMEKVNVRSIVFTTSEATNPTIEGQMVYHGTTPSIKVLLGGVVKTITVT